MLSVTALNKKYTDAADYALKNVSFTMKKGEIVGLIGKNGAGKTTLMKMLVKTLKPTSGTILLNGVNIYEQDWQLADVGILIEPAYYAQLTALENLNFYLAVNQKEEYKKNIETILRLVDLWENRDQKPNSFSFGMKQRLSLAMSLVTEPEFAIMDEPFVGLDPLGVASLIHVLKDWVKEKNMTVLISSHQLSELEELCERFLYINQGELSHSFDRTELMQTNLLIHTQHKLDEAQIVEAFGLVPINEKTLNVPGDHQQINEVMSYLANNPLIASIETAPNEQLKKYFTGE